MKRYRKTILISLAVVLVLAAAFILPGLGKSEAASTPETESTLAAKPDKEETKEQTQTTSDQEAQTQPSDQEEQTQQSAQEEQTQQPEKVQTSQQTQAPQSDSGTSSGTTATTPQTPETKPQTTPESPQTPETKTLTCTLRISCATILNNMDKLTAGKESLVPADGTILGTTQVQFEEGDTVYTVLLKELQNKKLHYEFSGSNSTAYIAGICNLYEFDCGNDSGWKYSVNGSFPGVGIGGYELSDGDTIAILYTCDLGKDIGS